MNTKIHEYLSKIDGINKDRADAIEQVKVKIRAELKPIFDADTDLQSAIKELETNPHGYMLNEYSDLESWVRFYCSDYKAVKEYLEDYLSDEYGYIYLDFEHDALIQSHGNEYYYIFDSGDVFKDNKCIVKADEYTDDDGNQDLKLRNTLIEQDMEQNGCYPEVIRGNERDSEVYLVNTKKVADD